MERFSESDCPSCCVPVPVDLMPDGDLVRYADAQVTIAALRARIKDYLEQIELLQGMLVSYRLEVDTLGTQLANTALTATSQEGQPTNVDVEP